MGSNSEQFEQAVAKHEPSMTPTTRVRRGRFRGPTGDRTRPAAVRVGKSLAEAALKAAVTAGLPWLWQQVAQHLDLG